MDAICALAFGDCSTLHFKMVGGSSYNSPLHCRLSASQGSSLLYKIQSSETGNIWLESH